MKIDNNELSKRIMKGANNTAPTDDTTNNTSVQVIQPHHTTCTGNEGAVISSNMATCTGNEGAVKIEEDLIFEGTKINPDTFLLCRDGANLFPLQNLSILKAQMKSGKTFAAAIFAAAVLNNWELQLKAKSPDDNANVIYIDTEQSPASTMKLRRRITYMYAKAEYKSKCPVTKEQYDAAAKSLDKRLIVANLRQYSAKVRRDKIAAIMRKYDNMQFMVIDGIKDICRDFNNIADVAETMDFVTNLALKYNVHILCILHENPNSDKARGHLGTELYNKATEIINVARGADNFEIKWEAIRDGAGVKPISFVIDSKNIKDFSTFAVPKIQTTIKNGLKLE